jgi:flagellum-specific peptidoglycan hydrolase FlgJ
MYHQRFFRKLQMVFFFLLTLGITLGVASSGKAVGEIRLIIDGELIKTSPSPVLKDDRTLIPIRLVSEKLGAQVEWNEQNRTVHIVKGHRAVLLRIDNRLVEYNTDGKTFDLCDVPPQITDGRTFVPLRLVSNALGVAVSWDGATRTVYVDSTKPATITPFFNLSLPSVQPGQVIHGTTELQVAFSNTPPVEATEIKYILLNPDTGRGMVVARGDNLTAKYRWDPELSAKGLRILAAAVYDQEGRFLTGKVVPVQMNVAPQVALTGATHKQVITDAVSLGADCNFVASYVKYEIINQDTGKVYLSAEADPQGSFDWTPQLNDNGSNSLRVIAYDASEQAYTSETVLSKVSVPHKLELRGISSGKAVEKPVTLWLSKNFPLSKVEYVLKDVQTGREEILAQYKEYSSYRWFPTPEQNGEKQLIARAEDSTGITYYSNTIDIKVIGRPQLLLDTVGPKQVITGELKLKSSANVSLVKKEYFLINPQSGQKRLIAGGDVSQLEYTWTPVQTDKGNWKIQVQGTLNSGATIQSEAVPVRVYLGKIYPAQPIIEKNKFLDLVSGLASDSREKTGMSAALQAAQAILETGWGQSTPVDKYTGKTSYNLFGIKGKGTAGSVTSNTWEEYNGHAFRIDADFRSYNNVEESWADHKKLLLTAKRYEPFRAVMHNSTQGAWALRRAGYATDSKYPLKLMNIIKCYNLHLLDEVTL